MFRRGSRAVLAAGLAAAFIPTAFIANAFAQDDSIVSSVAPQVAEVISGGSWSAGSKGGMYRAIVVMGGTQQGEAHLYLQWLSFENNNPVPTVTQTVPVKEVNGQKLPNANVDIVDAQKDNEITFVIGSYDEAKNKDTTLFVKATAPGSYALVKAPPAPPRGPAGGPPPKQK